MKANKTSGLYMLRPKNAIEIIQSSFFIYHYRPEVEGYLIRPISIIVGSANFPCASCVCFCQVIGVEKIGNSGNKFENLREGTKQ